VGIAAVVQHDNTAVLFTNSAYQGTHYLIHIGRSFYRVMRTGGALTAEKTGERRSAVFPDYAV
jgi:hypothetical protein